MDTVTITQYADATHRSQVVALWKAVFAYEAPHNQPEVALDKKLAVQDRLLFVALAGDSVVGTVMAGYDGHRGWIYSLAVAPSHRKSGIGSRLMATAERALAERGCMKINLLIVEGNEGVVAFYESLGFSVQKFVGMGKMLVENIPQNN